MEHPLNHKFYVATKNSLVVLIDSQEAISLHKVVYINGMITIENQVKKNYGLRDYEEVYGGTNKNGVFIIQETSTNLINHYHKDKSR